MHYFARLNADPAVHVTYSGLMYRVVSQQDLDDEATDMNLLTNPNPDIHALNIDYEGRFAVLSSIRPSTPATGRAAPSRQSRLSQGCTCNWPVPTSSWPCSSATCSPA